MRWLLRRPRGADSGAKRSHGATAAVGTPDGSSFSPEMTGVCVIHLLSNCETECLHRVLSRKLASSFPCHSLCHSLTAPKCGTSDQDSAWRIKRPGKGRGRTELGCAGSSRARRTELVTSAPWLTSGGGSGRPRGEPTCVFWGVFFLNTEFPGRKNRS